MLISRERTGGQRRGHGNLERAGGGGEMVNSPAHRTNYVIGRGGGGVLVGDSKYRAIIYAATAVHPANAATLPSNCCLTTKKVY